MTIEREVTEFMQRLTEYVEGHFPLNENADRGLNPFEKGATAHFYVLKKNLEITFLFLRAIKQDESFFEVVQKVIQDMTADAMAMAKEVASIHESRKEASKVRSASGFGV